MPKPYSPPDNFTLIKWVESILNPINRKSLTEWEDKFVVSIDWMMNRQQRPTRRQVEILERIYAEKTR